MNYYISFKKYLGLSISKKTNRTLVNRIIFVYIIENLIL